MRAGSRQPTSGATSTSTRNEGEPGFLLQLHATLTNCTLVLIAIHVAGALAAGLAHRENLIGAVIIGRNLPEPTPGAETSDRLSLPLATERDPTAVSSDVACRVRHARFCDLVPKAQVFC